jgi:hypothetical protein
VLGLDRSTCGCDVALKRLDETSTSTSFHLGRTVRQAVELITFSQLRAVCPPERRKGKGKRKLCG